MLPVNARKTNVLAACAIGLTVTLAAAAGPYPQDLIRVQVAAAPGTPPDIISRMVATDVSQAHGWKIVVEDRPGAMQTLAAADVLRQPADGQTLLSVSLPAMTAPALLPNVGFNLASDFAPVAKLSTSYNVLVVHPSVPARSVAELVDVLKKRPNQLTFSSGGFGTPAHLAGELFKLQAGVQATHVPYQQLSQAIGDLIGGTNQYMFVTTLPVLDLIATGKLRALAVTAPTRLSTLPDVPSMVEAGYPQAVVQDWVGYLVKRGTPDDVIHTLNQAINTTLARPEIRTAFGKIGAEPATGTPEEFGKFIAAQSEYWEKVVRDSGMKLQP